MVRPESAQTPARTVEYWSEKRSINNANPLWSVTRDSGPLINALVCSILQSPYLILQPDFSPPAAYD